MATQIDYISAKQVGYIRGGIYANKHSSEISRDGPALSRSQNASVNRKILLAFEIDQPIQLDTVEAIFLSISLDSQYENVTLDVSELSDVTWDPGTVTWNSMPSVSASVGKQKGTRGRVKVELTGMLKPAKTRYSVVISHEEIGHYQQCYINHAKYRKPTLEIHYHATVGQANQPVSALYRAYTAQAKPSHGYALYDWSRAGAASIPIPNYIAYVKDYASIRRDVDRIQAAIDDCAKHGGGTVMLENKTYHFNQDKDQLWTSLFIQHSNIHLKGGMDAYGNILTEIKQHTLNPNITSLHTDAIINVKANMRQSSTEVYYLTKDAKQGSHILHLNSSSLQEGDALAILMLNSSGQHNLSNHLLSPLKALSAWRNFSRWAPFRMLTRVKKVIDQSTIEIEHALPLDIEKQYRAHVRKVYFDVENIMIENIKLTGHYHKRFVHRGDENLYGWCALNMIGVHNSMVRNIRINDHTQGVFIAQSLNVTAESIHHEGTAGHSGITLGNTWHSLVKDVSFNTNKSHFLSVTGDSVGNVFSRIENTLSDHYGTIDLHGGGFPTANLFELITNMRCCSGGATQNMPHAGQYNTFWNIKTGEARHGVNEFFAYGYFSYSDYKGKYTVKDTHKLHPKGL